VSNSTSSLADPTSSLGGPSDFENSVNYFKTMEEEKKTAVKNNSHNHTVRQYPPNRNSQNISYELENVYHNMPVSNDAVYLQPRPMSFPPPTYGCLKNGNLPTYRTMIRQTQKTYPSTTVSSNVIQPMAYPPNTPGLSNPSISIIHPSTAPTPFQSQSQSQTPTLMQPQTQPMMAKTERDRIEELKREQNERLKKISELTQIKQLVANGNNPTPNKLKYTKRKKTLKRTYYIGKSKVFPKVGVLVSNKTIRRNISTKAQLLKQVPMEEIKKFLIKRGFIKIGTTAPNDVLRKMYESAVMMGGEIQNYNSENLLFNYLNDA
jgi:hypothetical protein